MLRSLNNLDERFHHSYFLYLLTGPEAFVTVEVYIVPLVALIGVLMLKVGGRQGGGEAALRQGMPGASRAAWGPPGCCAHGGTGALLPQSGGCCGACSLKALVVLGRPAH